MSKTELVEFIAAKAGLTKADATRALDATIEGITTGLKKEGKVALKTPTFDEIFSISYYKNSRDSKIYNQFLKQILPCVMEGKKIPKSLVKSAVCNLMLRSAFSGGAWWNSLCTTCALISNYRNFGGKRRGV